MPTMAARSAPALATGAWPVATFTVTSLVEVVSPPAPVTVRRNDSAPPVVGALNVAASVLAPVNVTGVPLVWAHW